MDPQRSLAVVEGFTRLFDKNLIYRANRLVNWSCALRTAISDIEVEFDNIERSTWLTLPGCPKKVEVGTMVYFAYKLRDEPSR
jgi:valyl-tRNA synthetase